MVIKSATIYFTEIAAMRDILLATGRFAQAEAPNRR